jgi:DNA-binding response OmpR family regulator
MMKMRLSSHYEVIDTDQPTEAVGLVLEHKPAAILLDLMMPKFSGFELCQNLHSLSYTSRIPIFVVSGESAARYREQCRSLGAQDFFEKPVEFERLKRRLAEVVLATPAERRAHVRVRLSSPIKLRGTDTNGNPFEESTITENLSSGGFLCSCKTLLLKDAVVDVYLLSGQEQLAGRVRVVRRNEPMVLWRQYGFTFLNKTAAWVLQDK